MINFHNKDLRKDSTSHQTAENKTNHDLHFVDKNGGCDHPEKLEIFALSYRTKDTTFANQIYHHSTPCKSHTLTKPEILNRESI